MGILVLIGLSVAMGLAISLQTVWWLGVVMALLFILSPHEQKYGRWDDESGWNGLMIIFTFVFIIFGYVSINAEWGGTGLATAIIVGVIGIVTYED